VERRRQRQMCIRDSIKPLIRLCSNKYFNITIRAGAETTTPNSAYLRSIALNTSNFFAPIVTFFLFNLSKKLISKKYIVTFLIVFDYT
jgi:hypothetical protein